MDNHQILQTGDLVQWYRIEEVLGRGGFGVTYLATDTNLDHRVAIKEYMPGWAAARLEDNSLSPLNDQVQQDFARGVESFLREARTLVKFRHPNIVRVMTVFEANNTAYLVMEYEEGEEFKSYVQRAGGIEESLLKSLILRIVDGLDQVHQYGFVHRDIKPVNLIVRKDGSPVLLDFGAARSTDVEPGAHTAFVSAGYTPIEQYQEGKGMQVGPWTDIYALGATLYYAVTGETPIGPTGRLAAIVNRSPDPLQPAVEAGAGRYSDSFLQAIDWAMSFKPEQRPRDLSEWRLSLGEESQPASVSQQLEPSGRESARLSGARSVTTRPVTTRSVTTRPLTAASAGLLEPAADKPQRFHQTPTKPAAKMRGSLAVALVATVAVVAGGGWYYQNYQQQASLAGLLAQADSEFNNGDLVNGALPLYRQVLGSVPDNRAARSRVAEIEQITRDQIDSALRQGDIASAEQSLTDFRRISTDKTLVGRFEQRIASTRELQSFSRQLDQARALVDTGQYQQTLDKLDELASFSPDDPQIAEIAALARRGLDDARQQQEQQLRLLEEQRRVEAQTRQRIAEANRRQRERRQSYNRYLTRAEAAVSEGDLVAARESLDRARALQISDSRLTGLEAQVVEQEEYLRKPLSAYEVSFASGQFNALRGAVESKNLRAIETLSDDAPSRQTLFDTLFERYTRLDARIIDVKSDIDPKRVTAKLRIEAMILPNGDIVYPSPAYRDTELTLNRQRYGWSRIIW